MKSFTIKYRGLRFLTCFAIVCLSFAIAVADNGDSTTAADDNAVASQTSLEKRLAKPISVEFRKTPIEDVLRIIADQADVDIVKSPKVTGEVTVTLTDVPLEEALNNILSVHGFVHVLSQNMIRVITTAEQVEKPEALHTTTFEIVYADVTEVVKALEKFKSSKGFVSFIQGTSHIIVTDTESKIREIILLVEKIDRMTPQILVEVRIYDVSSTEDFDLGVNWHVGRNTPITEISQEDTRTRTDTATGPTDTRELTKTWDLVDEDGVPVGDPAVEYKETTKPATTGYEITDIDETTKSTAGTWLSDSFRKSKPYMGGEFSRTDGGTLRFGLLNDAVDIELALNILHKQISAKLLANPRILVLDNETATFKAIREIPYQELTESSMGGSMGTTAFKDVGVELEVTPHVAIQDGMIRLHLMPKFSVEAGEVIVAGVGVTLPQPVIDKREAETTLLIKSGQTVVLAGLRKREVTQDIRKVPLLGDIPIIRGLFRSETESTVTSELIVFITPWITERPILTKDMTDDEKQAYEKTAFKGPKPAMTKAEKKPAKDN